jgi:phosphopantothenoylcysteine decarboxylase/phosphopantothenate--cysteine ligase
VGELACKDIGQGKLATVEYILNSSTLASDGNKGVVTITTGATVAPLDTVRYLTNPSSGMTGIEIAKSFLKAGHKVNLICGHNMQTKVQDFDNIQGLSLFHASTADKMLELAQTCFEESDIYISAAAICDIKFQMQTSKIKKETLDGKLLYEKEVDILKTLSEIKTKQTIIGFAAESELNEDKLKDKMISKKMDILIANIVNNGISSAQQGFNQAANGYLIISNDSLRKNMTKKQLANFIVQKVEAL